MYLIETDAALVSLTSRLALKSCCLSEHMWAAERQSPYLLFECDTAHISQEDRAVSVYRRASCDLETAWPLEEFTLELRTFTGYVWAVHRMFCCRWDILARVQVQPVLCCVICLSVHSNSTFMMLFDTNELLPKLDIQTRRTRGCFIEISWIIYI